MKKFITFIFIIVFIVSFSSSAFANETQKEILDSIDDKLDGFTSTLPDYIIDFLPNEVLSGDYNAIISEGLDEARLIEYIIDYLLLGINKTITIFSSILVLLLISSILNTLSASLSNSSLSFAFNLCSSLCVALTVFNVCVSIASYVTQYTKILCQVMSSFAPIMTSILIMSGKISTATITNATMILLISITDGFLIACMLPLIKICMMFSCVKSIGGVEFGGLSKLVRNTFTSVTVFIMSLFMFIFSFKNILTQGADTVSLKTARFAISSFVPIVGASINDALRTLASSISLIKSSCGVLAILIIALIMIPIIIYIFLNKISFGLLAGISRVIKCDNQASILEEADSLCSYMLTLTICTCVLFIFAITIFIKTSSEVGL